MKTRLTDISVQLLATLFGIGFLRPASGSWGSLWTAVFCLPLLLNPLPYQAWILTGLGLAVLALGVPVAGAYDRRLASHDHSDIVIDEAAGQILTFACLAFVYTPTPLTILYAVLMFRLMDIVKPFPASWCDRRLKGGAGVMLDDAVAGLYAGLFVIASLWLVDDVS